MIPVEEKISDITIAHGFGYWVFSYIDCNLLIEEVPQNSDDYITMLEPGWNTIGLPFDQSIDKIDLLIDGVNWSAAVNNGWVSDYMFGWNQEGQYYDFSCTLIPGFSYWMFSYQPCIIKN